MPASVSIAFATREGDLDEVVRTAAGKYGNRLLDLKRVPDRIAKWCIHRRQQRGDVESVGAAERNHRLCELRRVFDIGHERPAADLHVEDE